MSYNYNHCFSSSLSLFFFLFLSFSSFSSLSAFSLCLFSCILQMSSRPRWICDWLCMSSWWRLSSSSKEAMSSSACLESSLFLLSCSSTASCPFSSSLILWIYLFKPLMFSSFFFWSAKFLLIATLTGASLFPLMGPFSLAMRASLKLACSFLLMRILPSPNCLIWSYFFLWICSSLLKSSYYLLSISLSLLAFSSSSSFLSSSLMPIFSLIF